MQNEEHYVNAIAGFDMRKHTSQSTQTRKLGYNDELQTWQVFDQATIANNGVNWWNGRTYYYDAANYDRFSFNDSREVSFYGSLVYTYDRRYTLSGTFRIDKSKFIRCRQENIAVIHYGLSEPAGMYRKKNSSIRK